MAVSNRCTPFQRLKNGRSDRGYRTIEASTEWFEVGRKEEACEKGLS